jgi:hypothetical protein
VITQQMDKARMINPDAHHWDLARLQQGVIPATIPNLARKDIAMTKWTLFLEPPQLGRMRIPRLLRGRAGSICKHLKDHLSQEMMVQLSGP